MVAAALLLLAARAVGADAPVLAFSFHGRPLPALDSAALEAIGAPRTVRVFEPYEGRELDFLAFDFDAILDAVYGEAWRREEELLFTCRDGYQPTVPVARFLEHRAWLAFERAGARDFSIAKLESGATRRVELSPFYLIWENLDDARVRREGDYGWPYQLVGVELIRTRERFPRMAPPAGAPPEVRAGFAAFRVHCSRCHKLNGEGGAIGPELNGAASPLALRERAWLRAWIAEPSRILPTARMEPLAPALPDRERTIDEILAYLAAMAAARSAGDEP
jgi:mono/diheme cytochrome c family protein